MAGEVDSELLERSRALAALDDSLAAVVGTACGRLALIRGEAGVGKTALLRRFCDDQRSVRVLWGSCDALFTPRPLGPFLDVARAVGGELERVLAMGVMPYEVADALIRELGGAAIVRRNAENGVTWLHSYVSADASRTFCVYEAPSPEAVRRAARRNGLPTDRITQVHVLDPYLYR